MITSTNLVNNSFQQQYFEDLSANEVTDRFQKVALKNIAIGNKIYALPGISKLNAIQYNKTLFEQYGWTIPKSFDEFVTLCKTIESTTDIDSFNPNAKYNTSINPFLEALCYNDVFAGIENRQWMADFISGKATFAPHIKPMYDMFQKLIDNKIVVESDYTFSATERGKAFLSGKIAMINNDVGTLSSDTYDFDYFPFPSTSADEGWVLESMESELGIPKKARSAAVNDAINKFLDFYASPEGQTAVIGNTALSSNLKLSYFKSTSFALSKSMSSAIDVGNKFSIINFSDETTQLKIDFSAELLNMIKGVRTADQSMAYVQYNCRTTVVKNPIKIAEATENFSVLEMSQMFADMFKEETGADIGLIANCIAFRGNLLQLYKGEITDLMIPHFKPRSYANKSVLTKVKMTGAQLLGALDKPMGKNAAENCIYAFSGLKCTVAPWNDLGSKMLSVTLADGTPIDTEKYYTVACWQGTVFDEFITETVETYGNFNNSYTSPNSSFDALFTKYLKAKGTVAPAKDGRITLVW